MTRKINLTSGGQDPRKLPKSVLLPILDRLYERDGGNDNKVVPSDKMEYQSSNDMKHNESTSI